MVSQEVLGLKPAPGLSAVATMRPNQAHDEEVGSKQAGNLLCFQILGLGETLVVVRFQTLEGWIPWLLVHGSQGAKHW